MTNPITPPPELVAQFWREASAGREDAPIGEIFNHGVYLAYQAGADQELEACCEWLVVGQWFSLDGECLKDLRAARRPKPPSLKEQALALIDACNDPDNDYLDDTALDTIRRALEALPE